MILNQLKHYIDHIPIDLWVRVYLAMTENLKCCLDFLMCIIYI